MSRKTVALFLAAVMAAAAVTGCGGSVSNEGASAEPTAEEQEEAPAEEEEVKVDAKAGDDGKSDQRGSGSRSEGGNVCQQRY